MFGIKTKILENSEKRFKKEIKKNNIAKEKNSFLKQRFLLWQLKRALKNEDKYFYNHQIPITFKTNPVVRPVIKKIANFNPNNLGNWSANQPFNLSTKLEKKVIQQLINLYHAKNEKLEGFISSGSTEGNLYAAWLGRNFLQKKVKKSEIILLKTSLTHYSIAKAANITGLKTKDIALNPNWQMSPRELEKEIKKLHQKGYRGFLIPLTIGYTLTGTNDPVDEVCQLIKKLRKQYQNISFFIWIDAAFSGLVKGFYEKEFKPLAQKEIQLFLTDYHKFAGLPYPSGIVLYRQKLRSLIEQQVNYIGFADSTISGSRSGMSAINIWFLHQNLGKEGIQELIAQSLREKKQFIKKIEKLEQKIKIITEKNSVQLALIPQNKTAVQALKKLKLKPCTQKIKFAKQSREVKIYKVFFLPQFK